jgi:hypothetical protein
MSFKIKSYHGHLCVNINLFGIHRLLKLRKLCFLFTISACVITVVVMELSSQFLAEPLLLPTADEHFTKC